MARHERTLPRLRCAIYTRKSTEEGLDQDFNSLHAQREACEAFIRSQRSEGWTLVPTAYDDGGVSGGTLERPGLRRLLDDIRAGRIDIVVVYKVDRLTRSLSDFAKLVESLDTAGASFVSVTQQFNTSTSMGRLTLNMLLSFAQFEREVTAERIRDKIAASKRKGMWMGGPVPLGYDVKDRALVPNAAEAETVRHIFRRYLALGSLAELKAELDRDGIISKRRTSRSGRTSGGASISRGALALMLRNPLYVGEVRNGTERHPGLHEAIVDRETWDAVQAKLEVGGVERRSSSNAAAPGLLAGMLFDTDGEPLTPSHASKGPARYRYYVSHRLIAGRAAKHADGWRLPAEPIEAAARSTIAELLRSSRTLNALILSDCSADAQLRLQRQASAIADRVASASGAEVGDLLRALDGRVEIGEATLTASLAIGALGKHLGLAEHRTSGDRLQHARPLTIRKRGRETKLVLGEVARQDPDPALVELLVEARSLRQAVFDGRVGSLRELARRRGREHRAIARTLPLAYLAPDIVEAILEGRQPIELTASKLKQLDADLLDWNAQRRALGFAATA